MEQNFWATKLGKLFTIKCVTLILDFILVITRCLKVLNLICWNMQKPLMKYLSICLTQVSSLVWGVGMMGLVLSYIYQNEYGVKNKNARPCTPWKNLCKSDAWIKTAFFLLWEQSMLKFLHFCCQYFNDGSCLCYINKRVLCAFSFSFLSRKPLKEWSRMQDFSECSTSTWRAVLWLFIRALSYERSCHFPAGNSTEMFIESTWHFRLHWAWVMRVGPSVQADLLRHCTSDSLA